MEADRSDVNMTGRGLSVNHQLIYKDWGTFMDSENISSQFMTHSMYQYDKTEHEHYRLDVSYGTHA